VANERGDQTMLALLFIGLIVLITLLIISVLARRHVRS
jgi:LPXTG-motif cell wall-anchored protein